MELPNLLALIGIIVSVLIPIAGKLFNTIAQNKKYSKRQNRLELINSAKNENEFLKQLEEFKKEMQPYLDQYFQVFMYDVYCNNKKKLSIPINIGGILEIGKNGNGAYNIDEVITKYWHAKILKKSEANYIHKNINKISRKTYEIKEYLNISSHYESHENILFDYKQLANKLIGIFVIIQKNIKVTSFIFKKHLISLRKLKLKIEKYQDYEEFKQYLEKQKTVLPKT